MVTTVTNLAGWPGSESRNDRGKEAVLQAAKRLLTQSRPERADQIALVRLPGCGTYTGTHMEKGSQGICQSVSVPLEALRATICVHRQVRRGGA